MVVSGDEMALGMQGDTIGETAEHATAEEAATPLNEANANATELVALMKRARRVLTRWVPDPAKADAVITNLQTLIGDAELLLGSAVDLHLIAHVREAQGTEEFIGPLYSRSLLRASTTSFHHSVTTLALIGEALKKADEAMAEKARNIARRSRQSALRSSAAQRQPPAESNHQRQLVPILPRSGALSTCLPVPAAASPVSRSQIALNIQTIPSSTEGVPSEVWFPGPRHCDDSTVLSLQIKYDRTDQAIQRAIAEQDDLEERRVFAEVVNGNFTNRTAFFEPQSDYRRVIYCESRYIDALKSFEKEDLSYIWQAFFRSLQSKKKVNYESFKPSWLDERTVFVYGEDNLQSVMAQGRKMPVVHVLRNEYGRNLIRCVIATWLRREPKTRAIMADVLSRKGAVVDLYPHIDVVENEVKFSSYTLSAQAIQSLLPRAYPCQAAIDAFLQLLSDEHTIVTNTKFIYHLISQPAHIMQAWPLGKEVDEEPTNPKLILVPLHDSLSHKWAVAIIRNGDKYIELFDTRPRDRTFLPIFPALLRWANTLNARLPNEGWSTCHRVRERMNVLSDSGFAVDSSIYMCRDAFLAKTAGVSSPISSASADALREAVSSSLQKGRCDGLFAHDSRTSPASAHIASPPSVLPSDSMSDLGNTCQTRILEAIRGDTSILKPTQAADESPGATPDTVTSQECSEEVISADPAQIEADIVNEDRDRESTRHSESVERQTELPWKSTSVIDVHLPEPRTMENVDGLLLETQTFPTSKGRTAVEETEDERECENKLSQAECSIKLKSVPAKPRRSKGVRVKMRPKSTLTKHTRRTLPRRSAAVAAAANISAEIRKRRRCRSG